MKIENNKIVENKIPLNLREFSKKRILFRLVNNKRGESFTIYEKAKNSTTIKQAFDNSYRYIDVKYDTSTDTHTINRKYVNLLVDIPSYIIKSKKSQYTDFLNQNETYIKENKVSNEIIENQKYFRNLVNSL
tara:strand:+ start:512 stop:907 length:396 start_codon:yes stop_codon:yes gene_type:complete